MLDDDKVSAILNDPNFWKTEMRNPDETQEIEGETEQATEIEEGQEPTQTETQTEQVVKPQEEPKEERMLKSEYYARLLEKDKKIRELTEQLKTPKQVDYKAMAKDNPFKVLGELGIDISQLIDMWVNEDNKQTNNNNSLNNEELETIKKELEDIKNERKNQSVANAIREEKQRIVDYVKEDPDRWELINARGNEAVDVIFEHAKEYYQSTGEIPDIDVVADVVEQYYADSFVESYEQLSKLNKIKQRLNITQATTTPTQQEKQQPTVAKPQATLSPTSETATAAAKTREEAELKVKTMLDNMDLFGD